MNRMTRKPPTADLWEDRLLAAGMLKSLAQSIAIATVGVAVIGLAASFIELGRVGSSPGGQYAASELKSDRLDGGAGTMNQTTIIGRTGKGNLEALPAHSLAQPLAFELASQR